MDKVALFFLIMAGISTALVWFRLFRLACFFSLLLMAIESLFSGFMMMFANAKLEPGTPPSGQPVIPLLVALLLVIVGILALIPWRKRVPVLPEKVSIIRWAFWVGGVLTGLLGVFLFHLALNSPESFGHDEPMAVLGCWLFALCDTAGAVLLYFASRGNSAAAPNLMRWWVLAALFIPFGDRVKICLGDLMPTILGKPAGNFTDEASWLSLAMLPTALLILVMALQWVHQPRRKRSVQTNKALGAA